MLNTEFIMTSVSEYRLDADDVLARLVSAVASTLHPLAVYLFGSRAEGRATPESDYDLLVVLPDDASDEQLDMVKAAAIGRHVRIAADIVPTTREVFVACRHNMSTIEGVAHARGRLVYGAL
jgi:predicted nucleotidyltransferase